MFGPVTESNVKIDNRNIVSYGLSGGLAYDIEVSRKQNSSFFLSPFVEASWIVNQKKADYAEQNSVTDVWSTTSFRLGVRASLEFRNPVEPKVTEIIYIPGPEKVVMVTAPGKKGFVIMPNDNTISSKNITGYYPILPHVFFEKGNKEIPSRYIILSKGDAQAFNENDLGNYTKGDYSDKETNVNQLLITYYNVMNIYGYRMKNNPNEQLTLRGCDPEEKDGEACAMKVKNYLVGNFGINANRIKIVVESPKKPSGSSYSDPTFSDLLNDENRRVTFVFSNEEMYKPITYSIKDNSSIDNDIIFYIDKDVPLKSWELTLSGENKSIHYGPFTGNSERINPSELIGNSESGSYNAKLTIREKNGKTYEENISFNLNRDKETKNATRYLMLFDYNKSDAIFSYETKIKKEITPGMSSGNTVIVHGHTDIIGNEEANQKLSQERAEAAKSIIDKEVAREDRKIDVQAVGIGQKNVSYTFNNALPEGRMYNRNVFIESKPGNYGVK
jgi:outer membrane protein OmpA-like peptidoglycan-associated protein